MKIRIQILIISILLLGCKSENLIEKSETITSFPSVQKLNLKKLKRLDDISVDGLQQYNDSVLLIRNSPNTSKFHFSLFNIDKKTRTSNLIETGRGVNQSMAFLSYGIYKNDVWVYDIIKNEFISTKMDSSRSNKQLLTNAPEIFYYNIQPLNNETFLASGDYDSDHWVSIVKTENNEVIKKIAPYPKEISRAQKNSYESFLFLNPSRDKAVLAGRFTDRIQIIDLRNNKSIVIKGPKNYQPKYDVLVRGDGKEISVRNDQTKYAFVKGSTTKNFIYLLYSGNIHDSSNLHYGKEVYIYNWEGQPIKKLSLPHYVLDISVKNDDSIIYAYNPKNKSLEFSKISL